jgi:hypothetical protein
MGSILKLIITEQQLKTIIKESFNINDENDMLTFSDNMIYNVFESIKQGKKIKYNKINPIQYKNALLEFMKYGEFYRFPSKIIIDWKNICLRNTILLGIITDIYGHSEHFPFEEFYNVFEIPEEQQDYSYYTAFEYLDTEYNIVEYTPKFSNGHFLISDYGLKPIYKLCLILLKQNNPNEIIVTINKILDISHQRSDLAELFIEGGSKSLDIISNG